jgi:asparagine synthase (glutamine-hydrolysing)
MLLLPVGLRRRVYGYLNSFAPHRLRREQFRSWGKKVAMPPGRNHRERFADWMTLFELKALLPNSLLMKVDRMSMAFGIEARSPFLDDDLVPYVVNLPHRQRAQKKIFLQAVGDLLPPVVRMRKKQGLRLPVNQWLQRELKSYAVDVIFSSDSFALDLFGNKELSRYLGKTHNPLLKIRNNAMLWRLMIFEIWLQTVGRIPSAQAH